MSNHTGSVMIEQAAPRADLRTKWMSRTIMWLVISGLVSAAVLFLVALGHNLVNLGNSSRPPDSILYIPVVGLGGTVLVPFAAAVAAQKRGALRGVADGVGLILIGFAGLGALFGVNAWLN